MVERIGDFSPGGQSFGTSATDGYVSPGIVESAHHGDGGVGRSHIPSVEAARQDGVSPVTIPRQPGVPDRQVRGVPPMATTPDREAKEQKKEKPHRSSGPVRLPPMRDSIGDSGPTLGSSGGADGGESTVSAGGSTGRSGGDNEVVSTPVPAAAPAALPASTAHTGDSDPHERADTGTGEEKTVADTKATETPPPAAEGDDPRPAEDVAARPTAKEQQLIDFQRGLAKFTVQQQRAGNEKFLNEQRAQMTTIRQGEKSSQTGPAHAVPIFDPQLRVEVGQRLGAIAREAEAAGSSRNQLATSPVIDKKTGQLLPSGAAGTVKVDHITGPAKDVLRATYHNETSRLTGYEPYPRQKDEIVTIIDLSPKDYKVRIDKQSIRRMNET